MGRKASEKAKLWFLVAWGITGLLPYYYQFVSPYIWGGCAWNSFNMLYYFAGFNGYLLLGHYLRNHDWSWSKTLSVCIPMFLAGYMVPVYAELPGWQTDMTKMQSEDEFPEEFNAYLTFLEEQLGVEIKIVSVGPDRAQTIERYTEE